MTKQLKAPAPKKRKGVTWCGPYAIATVLGITYEEAEDIVNNNRANKARRLGAGWSRQGSKPLVAMWNGEMGEAIRHRLIKLFAFKELYSYDTNQHPTMTQWYKTRPDKQGLYLVQITGHYVVINGTKIIDNQLGEWKTFASAKHNRRSRVKRVWQLS